MDSSTSDLDRKALEERRAFLRTAGRAAITAPAVTLLLAASTKPAAAAPAYGPILPGCRLRALACFNASQGGNNT